MFQKLEFLKHEENIKIIWINQVVNVPNVKSLQRGKLSVS